MARLEVLTFAPLSSIFAFYENVYQAHPDRVGDPDRRSVAEVLGEDQYGHRRGNSALWRLGDFALYRNPGMAFGWKFGGEWGKLALSLFRILAVGLLIYYIRVLIREKVKFGLLVCFALILAGAIGNIIDSAFYGLLFSASTYHATVPAEFLPEGGGYGGFLLGKVVDMFYFPLFRGTFPDWLPFWGGEPFLFFRPVFNLADSAITVGIGAMLLFYRDFFSNPPDPKRRKEETAIVTTTPVSETDG